MYHGGGQNRRRGLRSDEEGTGRTGSRTVVTALMRGSRASRVVLWYFMEHKATALCSQDSTVLRVTYTSEAPVCVSVRLRFKEAKLERKGNFQMTGKRRELVQSSGLLPR